MSPRRPTDRLPVDDLVLVLAGVLRTQKEGMTTYQIVEVLGEDPALPAQTASGRFRQLERVLRSDEARAAGIVAEEPEAPPVKRGRPPKKIWRYEPGRPLRHRAAA